LNALKDAHKAQDLAAIDKAMAELNTAFQAASAEMYAQSGASQAQPGAGAQQGAGSSSSSNNDETVQDADFEEVK
jgi:molecular chaperone DnaK